MTVTTKEQAQAKARALVKFLAAKNIDLGYRCALDAVAVTEGLKNWNVLSAQLDTGSAQKTSECPKVTALPPPTRTPQWTADLVRVSEGVETFWVEASSTEEMLAKAEAEAADLFYTENEADWFVDTLSFDGKPVAIHENFRVPEPVCLDYSTLVHPGGLCRYQVRVLRRGIAFETVTCPETFSPGAADIYDMLLAKAGEGGVSEKSSEYLVQVLDVSAVN